MTRVILGLGSNIEPDKNIQKARGILAQKYTVLAESRFKTTKPVGMVDQQDFINGAVLIETDLDQEKLKNEIDDIEKRLGRDRSQPRFGPRTIDIDIVVWDTSIVDQDFYKRDFLKESVLELVPDLQY